MVFFFIVLYIYFLNTDSCAWVKISKKTLFVQGFHDMRSPALGIFLRKKPKNKTEGKCGIESNILIYLYWSITGKRGHSVDGIETKDKLMIMLDRNAIIGNEPLERISEKSMEFNNLAYMCFVEMTKFVDVGSTPDILLLIPNVKQQSEYSILQLKKYIKWIQE